MRATTASAHPTLSQPTPDARRLDNVTRSGVLAAVAALLAVSGGLLWFVGYNYDGLTGNPITKIHPFTYMIVALAAWRSLTFGNPVGYGVLVVSRRPATALMLLVASSMLVVTAARAGPGIAGYADTFIGPALLVFLLVEIDERDVTRLTVLLHVVMTANALLGLYEFATNTLVFPYRLDGVTFINDTRSSALQGHPLVNASLTAIYVMALLGGAKSLPNGVKLGLIGLQCAALVVFGGRSAMVTVGVLGGLYIGWLAFAALRRDRISLLGAAVALAILSIVPALIFTVISAGLVDKILMRFVSDGGSAIARVAMFDLFPYFSLRELIVGPDVAYVDSLRRINGLEWGIENPIVRMILYQGAFVTMIVLGSFGLFLRELIQNRERRVWLPILATLILLNTSESIAVKTTLVAKIVIIVVCLFRPTFQRATFRPSAATISGSNSRVRSSMIPMPSKRFQNAHGNRNVSAPQRTSSI